MVSMYGWCKECEAVTLDGYCSKHGKNMPLSHINAIDVNPLPEFEKKFLNERMKGLELGNGVFLVYADRMYRRRVVVLDKPLIEIKLKKDGTHIIPLTKGKIEGMEVQSIVDANRDRVERLAKVSKAYSQWEIESNKNAIISFSGGKDSTVLSHLLREFKLKSVFIDTRIEFPETYKFIEYLKEIGWDIDIAKATTTFFQFCADKGYPKYKNRWCCKTQKFKPFAEYIKTHFGNENVIVFNGMRRFESLARLDQPLKKKHKHITNEESVQPLLDWLSLDSWIYTWMNKLPISKLYDYFERGGCWTCPFGLTYRLYLLKFSHSGLFNTIQKFRNAS